MVTNTWNAEEVSLLRALALQTPCLTSSQITRGWFAKNEDAQAATEQSLARLSAARLITQRVVEAHPLQTLEKPLFTWQPGDAPPGERRLLNLALRARERWQAAYVPTTIYVAAKKANQLFGAFLAASHTRECEATHNLHLGELLVRYRTVRPKLAAAWWGEAAFPKLGFDIKGMKDPDAFLLNTHRQAVCVVEFTGSYSVEHLQKFHEHCAGGAALRLARFLGLRRNSHLGQLYSPTGTAYELW